MRTTSKPEGKKLKLNKETVKDLDTPKAEKVKGGIPIQRTSITGSACCATCDRTD